MSILAGFDLVIELNTKIIENAIATASFGGTSLSPPTEIVVGDKNNGIDAILLDPVTFTLEVGTDGIKVSIPFDETTVYYNGRTVSPLKGVLQLNGTLSDFATDTSNTIFDIGLLVPPSGVSIIWDSTSGSYTQNALSTLSSSDRSDVEALLRLGVSAAIETNRPRAGISFNEDGSKDGLLGKSGLRFRSVDVQNIDAHTIGVFCMMLSESTPPSAVARTEPGLTGILGVAVSMSQATFNKLVFCPGVADSLISKFDPNTETPDQFAGIVSSKMPSVCGSGDYAPMAGGFKLIDLGASFATGYIEVAGKAVLGKTDIYCFRADADFNTHLVMSVMNGAIQGKLDPNPPNINSYLDVSWFCFLLYFVAAFIVSPITALLAGWILFTLEWLTMVIGPMMAPGLDLGQTQQVGLTGFTLDSVDVFPDRLTLLGKVQIVPPPAPPVPSRSVVLAITDSEAINQTQIGSGYYNYPGSKFCKPKQYPYTEDTDEEVFVLTATPFFMGSNPVFKWSVAGVPITGTNGDLALTVGATIPQPGDLTLSLGMKPTTVSYVLVNDRTLQLTGHGDFNYSANVTVECDSQTKFAAQDGLMLDFVNHTVTMGDDYDDDMRKCRLASKFAIDLLRTTPQAVPRGGDGPDYGVMVQTLKEALLQGRAGATEALIEGMRIFGSKLVDDVLAYSEQS